MRGINYNDRIMLDEKCTFAVSETFGTRLRRLRVERGLTLAQLGEQLDVSKPSVWAWENERARPNKGRISAIARILGVAERELTDIHGYADAHEVLAHSREAIATAFGTHADKVKIMIEL